MIMESTRPMRPAAMRIQPTAWMLRPLVEPVTANARIAPPAMRRMLTGIPMRGSYPPRIEKERARQPALARVLLERLDAEARPHERRHDLPEAPEPFREVVVVPALEAVDAKSDRVRLVHEQLSALVQRSDDARRPGIQVAELPQRSLRRVDEVEAAAPQLRGQRLRVGLDPEDRRPLLARRVDRRLRRVDSRHDGALRRELGARTAAAAAQVQDALLRQVAERCRD